MHHRPAEIAVVLFDFSIDCPSTETNSREVTFLDVFASPSLSVQKSLVGKSKGALALFSCPVSSARRQPASVVESGAARLGCRRPNYYDAASLARPPQPPRAIARRRLCVRRPSGPRSARLDDPEVCPPPPCISLACEAPALHRMTPLHCNARVAHKHSSVQPRAL